MTNMFGRQSDTSAWTWLKTLLYIIRSPSTCRTATTPSRYAQIHTRPPLTHHHALKALHNSLPQFRPYISASLLPQIALVLLVSTFALTFYFSTSVQPCSLPVPCGTHATLPQPSKRQHPYSGKRSRDTREHPRRFRRGCPFL